MQPDRLPSVPNGVDDFIAGTADVAFFALQGGKTREEDAAVGIRWLAVEDTPEAEAAMQEFAPTSYVKVVEPGEGSIGVDEPTPMMGYDYVLTAGAHVPKDTIHEIVKLLHDNPGDVCGILDTFAEFEPGEMAPEFEALTQHPGAEWFCRDAGMMD